MKINSTHQRAVALLLAAAATALVIWIPRGSDAQGTPETDASPVVAPDTALMTRGEAIFSTVCVACHQPGGAGVEGIYPPLAGNPIVTLEDPRVVVSTVLNGRGGMPRFGGTYENEDIAAIITYIRNAFGNSASAVTPDYIQQIRDTLAAPPIA